MIFSVNVVCIFHLFSKPITYFIAGFDYDCNLVSVQGLWNIFFSLLEHVFRMCLKAHSTVAVDPVLSIFVFINEVFYI